MLDTGKAVKPNSGQSILKDLAELITMLSDDLSDILIPEQPTACNKEAEDLSPLLSEMEQQTNRLRRLRERIVL